MLWPPCECLCKMALHTHMKYLLLPCRVLTFALVTAAAYSIGGPQRANAEPQATGGEWFGFSPYANAREVCSQSVLGQGGQEILWHQYATKDKLSAVIAFYVKVNENDKDRHSEVERKGDESLTIRRGDTVLSVQAANSDYPNCGRKVTADERTVVIVSRIIRR